MTKQTAEYILEHSDLLTKSNCKIVDDILYERLTEHVYRFFFSVDDYDYVEDPKLIARLNRKTDVRSPTNWAKQKCLCGNPSWCGRDSHRPEFAVDEDNSTL